MNDIDQQIAAIDPEGLEWLNAQLGEFMQPSARYFDAEELGNGDDDEYGWYARLSAPGYLDCTDWQGPYDSEAAALVSLYETFGE